MKTCCICADTFDADSEDGLLIPSQKYGRLWFCSEDREEDGGFMKHIWKYKKQGVEEVKP